ncbi:hypothetical protein [Endozoicomonas sp. GU-1]|uniref:hypothetical protein n=1 Tax=Endozoicomonas sp. GU-1 TaxID=3009078 RepID=UPI0022B50A4A|nr:hypothetical protein [Endozoicomonas sp. GU-1]WBA82187.1 hypothetical protein O2T12_03220 [Endozoicomonas sp. GU-1]WBA85127.1 hypothetical protein O3276_17930 [Endozoicomonas sp. GU-1]
MPLSKNKALAEKLISLVSKEAAKIPDFRPKNNHAKISLHDAVMCGLAVMHLKYPSLLKFDQDCLNDADKLHNLKSLYGVEQVPSDSRLRELLDPIEARYFRKFFTILFAYVQRSSAEYGTAS